MYDPISTADFAKLTPVDRRSPGAELDKAPPVAASWGSLRNSTLRPIFRVNERCRLPWWRLHDSLAAPVPAQVWIISPTAGRPAGLAKQQYPTRGGPADVKTRAGRGVAGAHPPSVSSIRRRVSARTRSVLLHLDDELLKDVRTSRHWLSREFKEARNYSTKVPPLAICGAHLRAGSPFAHRSSPR